MNKKILKNENIVLSEIAEIVGGFAFKSEFFNEQEIGIPLIRIRDLKKGKSKTYYSGKYDEDYIVKQDDLLIGMDGEFKIYPWRSEPSLLNQRVCKLVINESLANSKYIFYIISQKLQEIEDKTPYVTVKHISMKQILSIKFTLPSIPIQKKIVLILEQTDRLKEMRKESNELTKDLLKSTFLEQFGNPFDNKKKWKMSTIGENIDIIKYGTGSPPKYIENGIRFIRATNIKEGRIVENGIVQISKDDAQKIEKCRLFENDLIIVRSGVNTGDCAVISKEYSDSFGGYDIIFHPNTERLNSIFLNEMLNLESSRMLIKQLSRRSGQPHINSEQVSKFKIILPPIDLQNQFAIFVKEIEKIMNYQIQSKEHIDNLFKSILQKVLKGETIC